MELYGLTGIGKVWQTYKVVGLSDLIWGFFQSALGRVDPPVTVVNVLLHIAHIVELKSPFGLFRRRSCLVLRLEALAVHLGALSKILLGIGEEVVRASTDKVRTADFGVGN